ncbi:hypothetical protein [Rhodovulum sulfidophilum]|uniref:hypothetical protein n=1 Tax=Rhodovulum sulfidophilum TaxID=35806 RepID=UPI000B07DD53|nr:hypothetical protein [Rhodovulum sulfidophilum]
MLVISSGLIGLQGASGYPEFAFGAAGCDPGGPDGKLRDAALHCAGQCRALIPVGKPVSLAGQDARRDV